MADYASEKTYPVTSVGPDEMSAHALEEIPDSLKWLVYWYETGGYEGAGVAIFETAEGTYGEEYLGHCSCYGPTDGMNWVGDMNADQLKELLGADKDLNRPRNTEDCDYAQWAALSSVVLRLLPIIYRDDLVAGE